MGEIKLGGSGSAIGTRKTILTQKFMASVPDKTRIIWLDEPLDTGDDLLFFLTQELQIRPKKHHRDFVLRII